MKAFLKNNRQAARKVRLIADAVRGKNVAVVLAELSHMPQKGATTVYKLIASASANAKQADATVTNEQLFVKTIMVDKGVVYTRYRPRAFGRAAPIHRECSHIRVELARTKDTAQTQTSIASNTTKEVAKKEKKTTVKKRNRLHNPPF